jgi:hypothetical protein
MLHTLQSQQVYESIIENHICTQSMFRRIKWLGQWILLDVI